MAPQIQQYYLREDFTFEDGTTLPQVELAFLDVNPEASKVAVVFTCFRGRLQSTLNFSNGALRDYRIITIALFGNGESSSPSNTPGFPQSIVYRDCIRAQHELITQHLGLKKIDVMVGFSMGGQCTYHWLAAYPEVVSNAIVICSSARTSRHNYQFLEGPSAALENSVDYADKDCRIASKGSPRGVKAFGKAYSAWLFSAEWFENELYKELGYKTLHDWDHDATGKNYAGWAPDDLLSKLRMWQKGDVTLLSASGGGSLEDSLSQIQARVLLMPCRTDQYFDWRASEKEAKMMKNASLKVIPSVWGHVAGSGLNKADVDWMSQRITEFLET
ncbi:hypothetical protein G7046_g3034 [Stylonectria norvegica]|nr:hypothetical protein G7046_g3034 [Stylonectria norvegica]